MIILDGKKTSNEIKAEIAVSVKEIIAKGLRPPHLAAVIVGDDGASLTYVGSKVRACKRVGFDSTLIKLPETISENELLEKVNELNKDENIDGYIVQLPLPKHIDSQKILMAVDADKDVDGFHPTNFGKMALSLPTFISATPFGIMELLKRYNVETSGKHTVVIGRSDIVGRPISILMSQKSNPGNSTVTLAHSRTKNIEVLTKEADIIISALGVPNFVNEDMVKEGSVIIDIGITRVADNSQKGYKIVGDVL
jgi:methylenetetrahydrofolate dehydrogenase (NADP+)/methenyltetrahydrofolate cyclohydrolase